MDDEREYSTSGRDVEGEISNQNLQPGNNVEEDTSPVQEEENINLNPKVRRALRMLETSYNRTMESMAYAFVGGTCYDYDLPTKFLEAWDHPVEYDRNKWRTAILKELNDMISRKVWRNVKAGDVPKNRRLIGSKWVFKVKKDRTFRARLCAIGYSQIAGIDYTDNFAPVVNDVTFRLIVVLMMVNEWVADVVDIVTAFLYGNLDEEIYLKLPDGLNKMKGFENLDPREDCCVLQHAMYGLVQAARQYYKKYVDVLVTKLNFEKCLSDACLLRRKTEKGTVIVFFYVDDNCCVVDREAVNEFKSDIAKYFKMTDEGEMTEFVGCSMKFDDNRKRVFMHQPDLISNLKRSFGEEVSKLRTYLTAAGTGEIIRKAKEGDVILGQEEITTYRSGVGMLLYLIKFSRPDLANSVRELSKVMGTATNGHFRSMLRVVKFVIDSEHRMLMFDVNKFQNNLDIWNLHAYCDSDYAGDGDERRSITGYCIYLQGCLIGWKSRAQRNVTLSSTEAEYVAVSEVCTEILFIKQVMEFLRLKIKLPITVNCDNVGAIFLSYNRKTSQRTKHVDIRYHFVREFVEDGIIKIRFVKSANNTADIFTKNVKGDDYERHSNQFMGHNKTSQK